MHPFPFEHLSRLGKHLFSLLLLACCLRGISQEVPTVSQASGGIIQSPGVELVIGLPEVPPGVKGTLALTSDKLSFTTLKGSDEIDRHKIIDVSFGNEQMETGGTTGEVVRMLIPYGGGHVLAKYMQKQQSLMTIEFRDARGQYHGAVFMLHPEDLAALQREFGNAFANSNTPVAPIRETCPTRQIDQRTVRLEPIETDDAALLPAEDRVLLYEYLIKRLKEDKSIKEVYRDGDIESGARCAELAVTLHVHAFKKGNQVTRARLGLLGMYIGDTTLAYHLTATTSDGTVVIDKDMKNKEGRDRNSLNVTTLASKSITKGLAKEEKKLRSGETLQ